MYSAKLTFPIENHLIWDTEPLTAKKERIKKLGLNKYRKRQLYGEINNQEEKYKQAKDFWKIINFYKKEQGLIYNFEGTQLIIKG